MANTYDTPDIDDPTHWIDPADIRPGELIRYNPFQRLAALYNFALAHVGVGPIIQESWNPGIAWEDAPLEDEAETPLPILAYQIPVVSTGHITLRVRVFGQRVAVAGVADPLARVEVRSRTAGVGVTLDLPALTGWVEDDLTIEYATDRADERFDTLDVYLTGLDGEWRARIDQLVVETVAIESPLPAAALDGAAPIGGLLVADDAPLSTVVADYLIEGIAAMYTRPVVGIAWSAVLPAYAASFPNLAEAPDGLGVESACPIVGEHGVVAHLRAGAGAISPGSVAPLRAWTRALLDGLYTQHEIAFVGDPLPGSADAVPHGYPNPEPGRAFPVGLSIWTRGGIAANDLASWAEEV